MANAGRPRALDELKKDQICNVIRLGGNLEMAARLVGCSGRTIFNEMERDDSFDDRLTRAYAAVEVDQVATLVRHGKTSWRAAAWFLKRRRSGYTDNPNHLLSREQIHVLLNEMAVVIVGTVPDPALRTEIIDRIEQLHKRYHEREFERQRLNDPPETARRWHFEHPPFEHGDRVDPAADPPPEPSATSAQRELEHDGASADSKASVPDVRGT